MARHLAQTCLSVLMKHDLELILNSFGRSGLVKTERKITAASSNAGDTRSQKKGQYVTV